VQPFTTSTATAAAGASSVRGPGASTNADAQGLINAPADQPMTIGAGSLARAGFADLNIAFNWGRSIISHALCGSHEESEQRRPVTIGTGCFAILSVPGGSLVTKPGGPFNSGDRHGVATDVGFSGIEPRGPTPAST
jgi:hypothetical protein